MEGRQRKAPHFHLLPTNLECLTPAEGCARPFIAHVLQCLGELEIYLDRGGFKAFGVSTTQGISGGFRIEAHEYQSAGRRGSRSRF